MADFAVSVVATIYNERHTIDRLLDSLMAQSRKPDEVVFCDGGSTDGTVEYLRTRLLSWADAPPFLILEEKGANISRGRNLAIAASAGPVIAVTDAGVRLDAQWLQALVQPWADAASVEDVPAVAGFFVPDVDGPFTTAMAATVLPLVDDIEPRRFLPSSRSVAFLKATWRAAGEYPEWLDYCEDLIFDLGVNAAAPEDTQPHSRFVWQPEAKVYFRPREDLGAFWRQYYLYARGDGKADLWRKRHLMRYLVYGVLAPALIGHGLWGRWARWLGWLGLVIGFVAYMARPWQRLFEIGDALSLDEMAQAILLVPVIRVVGDLAKMAGYPAGLWWRFSNRRRSELWWQHAQQAQATSLQPEKTEHRSIDRPER